MMLKAFVLCIAILAVIFGAAFFELAGQYEKTDRNNGARGLGLICLFISVFGFYTAGGMQWLP